MCSIQTIVTPSARSRRIVADQLRDLGLGQPAGDLVEQEQPRPVASARASSSRLRSSSGRRPGDGVGPIEQIGQFERLGAAPSAGSVPSCRPPAA